MPAQTRSVVDEQLASSIASETVSGLIPFPGVHVPTYTASQPQFCSGVQSGWKVPIGSPLAGSLPETPSLNCLNVRTFKAVVAGGASGASLLRSEIGIDL